MFSFLRKKDATNDIYKMNWGSVTPEFSNEKTNTFLHVFNHELSTHKGIEMSIRFAIGRITWYNKYLNLPLNHRIIFDDIGQNVTEDTKRYITEQLKPYTQFVQFESERG